MNNWFFSSPQSTQAQPQRPRRINWRQEYLHLTTLLMMAFWLAPWIALTLGWFIDLPLLTALEVCIVHLLLSLILVRWLIHRRASHGLTLAALLVLMWVAAGITVLLTPSLAQTYRDQNQLELRNLFYIDQQTHVPAGPLVIFWVLYLWWRSYKLSSVYATLVRASFGMRLGILAFLWWFAIADPALREDALPLVPLFFFFGLLSSALARADSLNLDRSGRATVLGRGWMIMLFGTAVIITLGGYIAALWLTGIDMAQVAEVLSTVGRVLLTLFFLLLTPILAVLQLAYDFIQSILPDDLGGRILDPGSGDPDSSDNPPLPWLSDIFEILGNILVIAIGLCVVLSVFALIWFLFVSRSRHEDDADEQREALGTGEVVNDLRRGLRDRWRRLAEMLGILRQFGLGRDLFTALTIRRIYARMEKLAETRGYPRTISETPYEYRRELYQAFPDQDSAIQHITEAYVAVRYGEVPEDPAELAAVRTAWDHLSHKTDQKRDTDSPS